MAKELRELREWKEQVEGREQQRDLAARAEKIKSEVVNEISQVKEFEGVTPALQERFLRESLMEMQSRGVGAKEAVARVRSDFREFLSAGARSTVDEKVSQPKQPGGGGTPAKQGPTKFSSDQVFGHDPAWEDHLTSKYGL